MNVINVVLLYILVSCLQCLDAKKVAIDKYTIKYDDGVIEKNPDYIPGEANEMVSDDEDDSESDSEEIEEDNDRKKAKTKRVIAKELAKNRKAKTRAIQFLKKHKTKIFITAALFAYRKEAGQCLWRIISGKNGKIFPPNPNDVLKIIIFCNIMRNIIASNSATSPSLTKNIALFGILSKFLQFNPIYSPPIEQHYAFERINDRYSRDNSALEMAKASSTRGSVFSKKNNTGVFSKPHSYEKEHIKDRTAIILDMTGAATSTGKRFDTLGDEISFLIQQHRRKTILPNAKLEGTDAQMEVIVLLESPGGAAQTFALAADQMLRLRKEPGIKVTICVDKVAASGGYMIACTSSTGRLFAAPFAVVGSIGVIGTQVNIHKALTSFGVTPLVFKGGENKAPVGLLGEVTRKDCANVQNMVDSVHRSFKRLIATSRPAIAERIDHLATGQTWLGYDALDLKLVDRLVTSDEYISEKLDDGFLVLKLIEYNQRRFSLQGGYPFLKAPKLQSHDLDDLLGPARTFLSRLSTLMDESWSTRGGIDSNVQARSMDAKLVSSAAGTASSSLKMH